MNTVDIFNSIPAHILKEILIAQIKEEDIWIDSAVGSFLQNILDRWTYIQLSDQVQ